MTSSDSKWGWWVGDEVELGPFKTRDEAISEALATETFTEFQNTDGRWRALITLCVARRNPISVDQTEMLIVDHPNEPEEAA